MFSKKAGKFRERPAGGKGGDDLAKMMGLGIPPEPDDDDEDEASLLAELAALEGRPAAKRKTGARPAKAKVSMADIEKMAADSLKDIDPEEDLSDDDFDENDLMGELDDLVREEDKSENFEETEVEVAADLMEHFEVKAPAAQSASVKTQPILPQQPQPLPTPKVSGGGIKDVLNERKSLYVQAIEEAKTDGNSSKVRRFQRALKELEGLIKMVQRGGNVNEDDIPPPVALKAKKSSPSHPAANASIKPSQTDSPLPAVLTQRVPASTPAKMEPVVSAEPHPSQLFNTPPKNSSVTSNKPESGSSPSSDNTGVSNEKLNFLLSHQKEFKMAALKMKHEGNVDAAKKYLSISKGFDSFIDDVKAGKDVDMSNIPVLPEVPHDESPEKPTEVSQPLVEIEQPAGSSSSSPDASAVSSGGPPTPKTVMEALEQRLEKFLSLEKGAKEEGNSGKVRRMGRIVKLYQEAIRNHKANKPVEFEDLPCPPGCGPFPVAASPGNNAPNVSLLVASGEIENNLPQSSTLKPSPVSSTSPATVAANVTPSRNQREHEFLLNRQKQFKMLALQAKKAGDIENAREYLRKAKGLDGMITAAENGLRVDITQVPSLPKKDSTVEGNRNTENISKKEVEFDGSTAQQYAQIENALRKQIEMSEKNFEHYKLLGNLDASKNFQSLYQSSKKDLETLLVYKKQRNPTPKCHSVLKTFPVVRSNPHLSDSELEINIVRCINVPLPSGWTPKDMYTYVTYEVAYPQEKPQVGNTTTKKETVNPIFNESFKVMIERKNRTFTRYCKRQGVNLKVNYVRGFLKSDKPLGQASIKFEKFNNRCEIHECIDLMDVEKGRKAVGGKIEVKLKIREPLVDKDAEIIKENWLVLDTHLRGLEMKTPEKIQSPAATSSSYESVEVLKFEKELCDKKIAAFKGQGKNPPQSIIDNVKVCQQKIHSIQLKLKEGGRPAIKQYFIDLTNNMEKQKSIAQDALRRNDKDTAKLCLAKKKLIEKEVAILKQRMGF